jgi:hypothetical protein
VSIFIYLFISYPWIIILLQLYWNNTICTGRVCVQGSVSVFLCERPCVLVCVCPCVCVSALVRIHPCLCLCVSICMPVCVHVSVCYNNGNFWETLHLAHPSSTKKELRVTSFATYGFCVLQILLLMVSMCYKFCYLRFLCVTHFCCLCFYSICTPINKCFQR